MVKAVTVFVAFLLPGATALSSVAVGQQQQKEKATVEKKANATAAVEVKANATAAVEKKATATATQESVTEAKKTEAQKVEATEAWHNPQKEISADADPLYSRKESNKLNLVMEGFLDSPVMDRYFTRNKAIAMVPSPEVQKTLMKDVFPNLSPFAKIGMIFLNAGEDSAPNLQQLKCVGDWANMLLSADHRIRPDYYEPYVGLKLFVHVNTEDPATYDKMVTKLNTYLKTIVPGGAIPMRSLKGGDKELLSYMAAIADFNVGAGDKVGFSTGDVGKDKIVTQMHRVMSDWIHYRPEAKEGERCTIGGDNMKQLQNVLSFKLNTANRHISSIVLPAWEKRQLKLNLKVPEHPRDMVIGSSRLKLHVKQAEQEAVKTFPNLVNLSPKTFASVDLALGLLIGVLMLALYALVRSKVKFEKTEKE